MTSKFFFAFLLASTTLAQQITVNLLDQNQKKLTGASGKFDDAGDYVVSVNLKNGTDYIQTTTTGYYASCNWFYDYPNATTPTKISSNIGFCNYPTRSKGRKNTVGLMPVADIPHFDQPDATLIMKCAFDAEAPLKTHEPGCSFTAENNKPKKESFFRFGGKWWLGMMTDAREIGLIASITAVDLAFIGLSPCVAAAGDAWALYEELSWIFMDVKNNAVMGGLNALAQTLQLVPDSYLCATDYWNPDNHLWSNWDTIISAASLEEGFDELYIAAVPAQLIASVFTILDHPYTTVAEVTRSAVTLVKAFNYYFVEASW